MRRRRSIWRVFAVTHFRTRAFLVCFVPFAVLLTCSFWLVQNFVESTVHDGLQTSLNENQVALANAYAKGDLQNSRFLKVAGDNAALKAGVQILLTHANSDNARRTVEDQLRELGEHMGFDLLAIVAPSGQPLAAVVRRQTDPSSAQSQLAPVDPASFGLTRNALLPMEDRVFQVASVPVDQDGGNLGSLAVGEFFNFSGLTTSAVLLHDGKAIESNLTDIPLSDLNSAFAGCGNRSECDLRLHNANWIALDMHSYGGGYLLRSLANVDRVTAPIQGRLRKLFISLALVCVLSALLCSIAASRSIERPIAAVVSHLRNAVRTGILPVVEGKPSPILEIRELTDIYNRAAISVRAAGENLQAAYLEFVGSLANALDARDRYTSGHSSRVSQLCCAVAAALQLSPDEVERIRIGALLHDIGKIGIADNVLQKPGRLTDEEFELVKMHPVIGRRILEGVQGFAPYLNAVELHHENWDGTGYPKGLAGEEVPVDARIIHVSDAYDAMTTDRSYRRGMTHERAISILMENAGIQFDPQIVAAFVCLPRELLIGPSAPSSESVGKPQEPELAVAE